MIRRRWPSVNVLLAVVMVVGSVAIMPASAAVGGLIWERPSDPGTSPFDVVVDVDGSYYVSCPGSASLEKFSSDGTHLWTFDVMGHYEDYTAHADVDETGVYLNIEGGGTVAKLDKATGAVIWTASGIPGEARSVCDVAVHNGFVFVTQPGLWDSWFTLDASTGAYVGPVGYSTPHPSDAFYYVEADDTGVYVWANEEILRRIDDELNVVWEVPLTNAGGMVLDGAGFLYVPDDREGTVRKISIADGSIVATLYGQDGCVGVGFLDGVLYTTSSSDDVVRTYAEPWPDPSAPQDVTGLTSPTHPSPESWYENDSPGFVWDFDPTRLYSWSIDQDPEGVPDVTADSVVLAGDAILGSTVTYPAPYDPQSVVVGDFDEDGEMDFAAGIDDSDFGVIVYLNKGDGVFETDETILEDSQYAEGLYAEDLNVADIDGDGNLDIAFYNEVTPDLGIIWGNGDGTFSDVSSYSTASGVNLYGLTVGDLDHSGGLDIAVNLDDSDAIEVWLGLSEDHRAFDKTRVVIPAEELTLRAITHLDLDADTYADLVFATGDGDMIAAINDGAGVFSSDAMSIVATTDDGNAVRMFRVADVNDDGYDDVVAFSSYSQLVLLGDGSGGLSESFDITAYLNEMDVTSTFRAFAVGDIDADGILDLAFGDEDASAVRALRGLGDGTFEGAGMAAVDSLRSGGRGIASADLDGDGRADVCVAGGGEIHVLRGVVPSEFNTETGPLEDGTWYFHVREINEGPEGWRGGETATFQVNIGGDSDEPVAQTIDNGTLKLSVNPDGTPEAYVWGLTEGADPGDEDWIGQYYDDDGWGSVLWVDGDSFSTGYAAADQDFEMVSNEVVDLVEGKQIVTILSAMDGEFIFTQTFTLMDGDRFYTKDWKIENVGDEDRSNLRFYHGGDTYFGGEDDASSYFDAGKSMVYVRNNLFNNWGIMGFFANPGSPADHYFGGHYDDGNYYAGQGESLPDTVDDEFQDAGYYLQWDRDVLLAGRSWSIRAYEIWTPGGPLQVLAPSPQGVLPGITVDLPFTLHNLSEVPQDIELSVDASDGWTAEVVGDTTPFIGAVERYEITVRVTVPAEAAGSADITLSVTGPESNSSGTTTLSIADVDLGLPGEVAFTAQPGELVWQNVVIMNNGDGPVTLGTLSMEAPFGSFDDSAHGATIPAGESLTVQVGFWPDAGGSFTGALVIPVVSPEFVTYTVPLTGNASVPRTSLPAPVYRFYSPVSGAHFYTMSAEERDVAIATWPDVWTYEGIAFSVDPLNDTVPVHRFYNRFNRSHFYTASDEEKAWVELLYRSVYSYEGTGFPASLTPGPGKAPVYRFYSPVRRTHFYTISEDEKATVIATMSDVYRYEGVGYYVTVALPD